MELVSSSQNSGERSSTSTGTQSRRRKRRLAGW